VACVLDNECKNGTVGQWDSGTQEKVVDCVLHVGCSSGIVGQWDTGQGSSMCGT
jgi:hypothetical protein